MKIEKNISREHLLYLRGLRNKSILINVARISIFAIFLILWVELCNFYFTEMLHSHKNFCSTWFKQNST